MKYLPFIDFDLMFQRTAAGYRAQVLDSPAGQASVEFALPFSDLEVENFLLRFGLRRQPVRRRRSSQIEAAQVFGGRLFEAAFGGEVRSCLRSSLDEVERLEAGLRIRLRFTGAPELNDLPWEFLFQSSLDRFLALSAETPLVRYLDLPERIRPLAVKPPLKVLTVISSPTDCAPLDVEAEWRKLQESVEALQAQGLLVLRRLESPTLSRLQQCLRREACHIFHFIGHGGFDPSTDDGLLLFTNEKGHSLDVTGQMLGTLLHDHRSLRLAVLNACEGARASRSDPFAGVAQSLVRQGIPAVVAMQFEISDKAAIAFAYELYAAVADGYPIDAALAESRKALFLAGHELEWGTPVLYMRTDGHIFDVEPTAAAALKTKPDAASSVPNEQISAPAKARPKPIGPKVTPAVPTALLNALPAAPAIKPGQVQVAPPPQPTTETTKTAQSPPQVTTQEQGRGRQAPSIEVSAPKEGIGPLGWFSIGCGAIILLGIFAMAGGGYMFKKKVVDSLQENPTMATAEMIVKLNPELELVSSDPDKNTLTVKNKKTGEVVTINAEDIKEGKITFEAPQGTTVVDASSSGDASGVKITGSEGSEVTFGGEAPKNLPAWVPIYPGSTAQGAMDATTAEGRSATFSLSAEDSVDEVTAFYESKLGEAGLKVEKNIVMDVNGQRSATVTGNSDDDKRTVIAMIGSQEGKTQATITFTAKN